MFVGSGTPAEAAVFQAEHCPRVPVVVDPSLAAFEGFALRRGLFATFGLGALGRLAGALRAGFRQGATQGRPLQQGGTFVIDREGVIRLGHANRSPGDHADLDQVLATVAEIGQPASA